MKDSTIAARQKRWREKNGMTRLQVWLSDADRQQLDRLMQGDDGTAYDSHAAVIRALLHEAGRVWCRYYDEEKAKQIKEAEAIAAEREVKLIEQNNELIATYNTLANDFNETQEGAQIYRKRAEQAESDLKSLRLSLDAAKAADLKTAQDEAAYWKAQCQQLRQELAAKTADATA